VGRPFDERPSDVAPSAARLSKTLVQNITKAVKMLGMIGTFVIGREGENMPG
jgi:hypothetical protein